MIVRHQLNGRLRLVTQHEHALLSGELARAWCGPHRDEPLTLGCILATTLHDLAWLETDLAVAERRELFDAERGVPHDFMTLPSAPKAAMYRAGLDEVERLDPYAALLGSRHYAVFVTDAQAPGFASHERARQQRLLERLGFAADAPALARELRLLQWFDLLSLALCMAGPDVADGDAPRWLEPPFSLDGADYTIVWDDARHASLSPWPFCTEAVERRIPVRDLALPDEHTGYPSFDAFREAYAASEEHLWHLRLIPG